MVNTKKDNIVIRIKDDAKQAEVLEELKKRMIGLKKLYKDEKLPIYISGKVLRNKEIDEIQAMINKYLDVKVVAIFSGIINFPASYTYFDTSSTFSKTPILV